MPSVRKFIHFVTKCINFAAKCLSFAVKSMFFVAECILMCVKSMLIARKVMHFVVKFMDFVWDGRMSQVAEMEDECPIMFALVNLDEIRVIAVVGGMFRLPFDGVCIRDAPK